MIHPKQLRQRNRLKHPELPFGVYWRNKAKPYIVKFWQRATKDFKYVGVYNDVTAATEAADQYLKEHR